ncbi:MAG: 3-deoxy-D-manno-octulosonic acid transferase [Limnohabitans sp.]|jgi:3-deoxy-D-manno-octulosonic-acid transferase
MNRSPASSTAQGLRRDESAALRLYGLLTRVLGLAVRARARRRARHEPLYAHALEERLGVYPGDNEICPQGWVWLHAVSLGETRAAALLVPALRAHWPGMRLLLTHSTATGWAQGQTLLQPGDRQTWLPWDSAPAVRRFLQHFRPRMGLLIETEVWPVLLHECRRAGVPVALLNARLSERSLRQALRLGWLARPAYAALGCVLAQHEDDAQRLQALGAPTPQVVGNLKLDAEVPTQARLLAARWAPAWPAMRPRVLLASTREGEETLWLQALAALRARLQPLHILWLLVPRHPQRFAAVAAEVSAAGLVVSRRSDWGEGPPALPEGVDVVLGDSMGEMQAWALSSPLALLGGSFAPLGGQNLIELIAAGCAVLTGPHTYNFADATLQACEAGVAWQTPDMAAALQAVAQRLEDPEGLAQTAALGAQWVSTQRGSVARHVQALSHWAPGPG